MKLENGYEVDRGRIKTMKLGECISFSVLRTRSMGESEVKSDDVEHPPCPAGIKVLGQSGCSPDRHGW